MRSELDSESWSLLKRDGYVRLSGIFSSGEWAELMSAASDLLTEYPYGFIHAGVGHDPRNPKPRPFAPRPDDYSPTIIIPHIGFRNPVFLKIVEKDIIYNTVSRVLGPDFVLSNTWLQVVPPGIGRLAYHKDPNGSFSFTVLLDDQGWNTGSTCVMPGSHRSTPPPRFCMDDPREQARGEVHMEGRAGDVFFFTPEAAHGRAANAGLKPTLRLFFACYGRKSHDTTTWAPAISQRELANSLAHLRPDHRHLLEVDNGTNRRDRDKWSPFRRWFTDSGKSSETLVRDFFFQLCNYTGRCDGSVILPYRNGLAGEFRFSCIDYLMRIKPVLALKIGISALLDCTKATAAFKNWLKDAL